MKKTLLVSTAIVATGLFASGAFAQEKPMGPLTVGGYFNTLTAVNNANRDQASATNAAASGAVNKRNKAIFTEGEVHFKGNTKLDNGLEIGFRAELELKSDTDQIDEIWIDFRGAFGRVILGQNDPATREMARIAPNGSRTNILVGINGWGYTGMARAIATNAAAGEPYYGDTNGVFDKGDAEKIQYFSPVFSGFQLGLSYAPDGSENRFSSAGSVTHGQATNTQLFLASNGSGSFGDVFDIAVTFVNTFSGGFGVNAMLGLQSADPEASLLVGQTTLDADGRQTGFNGALILSFAGFDFGGTFAYVPQKSTGARLGAAVANAKTKFTDVTFDLGVAYTTGPWKAAITYLHADMESMAQTVTTGSSLKVDKYLLSGSYLIGPGLEVSAGLAHEKIKYDATAANVAQNADKGTTLFVGTSFQF